MIMINKCNSQLQYGLTSQSTHYRLFWRQSSLPVISPVQKKTIFLTGHLAGTRNQT